MRDGTGRGWGRAGRHEGMARRRTSKWEFETLIRGGCVSVKDNEMPSGLVVQKGKDELEDLEKEQLGLLVL